MQYKSKGFTLIELLVVIAIIGILSTVVMLNISSARGKASNASVKAGLKSIITAAQALYEENGVYSTVCSNADILAAYTSAGVTGGGSGVCNNSATKWVASAPLKIPEDSNTYWCVDYKGTSKGIPDQLGGAAYVCP